MKPQCRDCEFCYTNTMTDESFCEHSAADGEQIMFYYPQQRRPKWCPRMKEEELKPCTCGGRAELILERYDKGAKYYGVRCTKCQKLQTMIDDEAKAVEAWNRRAET